MEGEVVLQVGVKVLLRNKDGRYLFVRRSREKYPEVGDARWDIVGGRIHPGIPLLENLAREVQEETGLTLVGTPVLVAAQDILRVPGRHVVRLTYFGEASGAVALDHAENDAYEWKTKEEVGKIEGLDAYVAELLKPTGPLGRYL